LLDDVLKNTDSSIPKSFYHTPQSAFFSYAITHSRSSFASSLLSLRNIFLSSHSQSLLVPTNQKNLSFEISVKSKKIISEKKLSLQLSNFSDSSYMFQFFLVENNSFDSISLEKALYTFPYICYLISLLKKYDDIMKFINIEESSRFFINSSSDSLLSIFSHLGFSVLKPNLCSLLYEFVLSFILNRRGKVNLHNERIIKENTNVKNKKLYVGKEENIDEDYVQSNDYDFSFEVIAEISSENKVLIPLVSSLNEEKERERIFIENEKKIKKLVKKAVLALHVLLPGNNLPVNFSDNSYSSQSVFQILITFITDKIKQHQCKFCCEKVEENNSIYSFNGVGLHHYYPLYHDLLSLFYLIRFLPLHNFKEKHDSENFCEHKKVSVFHTDLSLSLCFQSLKLIYDYLHTIINDVFMKIPFATEDDPYVFSFFELFFKEKNFFSWQICHLD
jgi:hypothetical protein